MEYTYGQSPSRRINRDDDHLISETEIDHGAIADTQNKSQSLSCFSRFRHRLCCKYRVYATAESEYEASVSHERSFSLSRQTMDSVQDAIDGKISLSKAKLHRYLTTPNWGPKKKFAPYSIWNFPLALFNEFGIGTKLFFEFTLKMGWLFLLLSILNIPTYIILHSGGKLVENGASGSFEQFSLGNLGDFNSSNINTLGSDDDDDDAEGTVSGELFGMEFDHQTANTVVALTDLLCICLLILFLFCFESTLRRKEKEYDDMTKTVGDFSVEVNNLPLNISSRRNLANWFTERWGEIMDVSICYNDGRIIKMYQKHSEILIELTKSKVTYSKATKTSTRAKETNKLQRLQTKLDESSLKMLETAQQFNEGEKHCVTAYVTFEHEPERNECLREFHNLGKYRKWKYFCSANPRFLYDDRPLVIKEAPEPSNIIYLNHGYSSFNLFCRRIITSILSIIIIVASFGLIFAAQFAAHHFSTETECDEDIEYDPDIEGQLDCYCSMQTLSASDAFRAIFGGDKQNVCSDWNKRFVSSNGLKLTTSVIIVVVNMVLLKVIKALIEKEKHCSVSSRQSTLAQKLFRSQFMNTAITILVLNADLGVWGLPSLSPLDEAYSIDFAGSWYIDVGNAIVTTLVMGCLNPHLTPLLKMKWEQRKRDKAIQKVSTQRELDVLFEGKPFTLSDRFAAVTVKLCVCLMYAPLLPILWSVAAVLCVMTYWMNKVFFLRIAQTPPKYDTATARMAVGFMKIGISLHLLMAVWVFGSKHRDPDYLDPDNLAILGLSEDSKIPTLSIPFAVLFVLNLFATYLAHHCCCCCRGTRFEDEADLESFSKEFVRSEHMESYLVCAQPTLENAFGPDLLPMEHALNQQKLEEAEYQYKKELAKEMVDELQNVDVEKDDDGTNKRENTEFLNVSPEFWSIRQVAVWIERLHKGKLKQYLYQFMVNKVDGRRLLQATDVWLDEVIGIQRLLHRSKILKAVRKLRIKAGIDPPITTKKLSKKERKRLEEMELENYSRHLVLQDEYTKFANDYLLDIQSDHSDTDHNEHDDENRSDNGNDPNQAAAT